MSLCIPRSSFLLLWCSFFSVTAESRELPWNAAYDLELEYESGYTQRVVTDLGDSRWIWWASGDLVLTRDTPAPAGMVEREYYLHNPVEGAVHRVGVSAGPLVFGPVLIQGGYRRMMDPSGGGVVPSAVTDTSEVVLDGAREPSSWDGVAITTAGLGASSGSSGGAGVAYLYNPARAHIALGHIGIAPAGARFGRLSFFGSAAEVLDEGRPPVIDYREEPWFRDVPYPHEAVIRGVAVNYRLERGSRTDEHEFPVPVFVLVEGHRQGHSWRPHRHAGQVVTRVGPPRVRVALRGVAVETGFLDADLTPPTRAAYRGVQIEGTERVPALRKSNRPSLAWNGDFETERRWDDGLPASPQQYQRFAVTLRSSGILSQCGVKVERPDEEWTASGALSTPDRWELAWTARLSGEFRWIPYAPERRIAMESSFRRTVDAKKGSGTRRTVVRWRVVGERPSTAGGWEGYAWDHFGVVEVPVGDAAAVSVHAGIENAGTDGAAYTGAVRFRWSTSELLVPKVEDSAFEFTNRE